MKNVISSLKVDGRKVRAKKLAKKLAKLKAVQLVFDQRQLSSSVANRLLYG